MRKVILTHELIAFVDDADFAEVSKFRWYGVKERNGLNAITNVKVNGKWTTKRMHNLLMKPSRGMVVDHINHDTLDNRRKNLRICTKQQNRFNSKPVYEHKGVSLHTTKGKWPYWRVRFTVGGKKIEGGLFKNKEEAIRIAQSLYKQHHGEFAYQP